MQTYLGWYRGYVSDFHDYAMRVGAARRIKSVNWSVVREMVLTWVLTFPGCGLVGYLMAKLFMAIF